MRQRVLVIGATGTTGYRSSERHAGGAAGEEIQEYTIDPLELSGKQARGACGRS
jgi:hypothetical protein